MDIASATPVRDLIECICLVYHVARNVRRPIREGKLPFEPRFERIHMLAQNRSEASKQMTAVRASARAQPSALAAADAFQRLYDLTLEDLRVLYDAPIWRYSPLGGRKWAVIVARVLDAVRTWDAAGPSRQQDLLTALLELPHRSGTLRTKLDMLEAAPDHAVA